MRRTKRTCALALWLLLALLLSACARAGTPAQQAAALPAGGQTLDYLDLPAREADAQAPPLLLLTGYAVTKEMWDQDFVRGLSAHRRLILLDNRGMGPSATPGAALDIADMARDAATLLNALGIKQADVLGWSMGGMVAQELALQLPELVRALILYATVPDNAELMPVLDRMAAMPLPELLGAMFPPGWIAGHPHASAQLPARPRPPDLNAITRQYAAMKHWTGTHDRLPALRMPVLVLTGGQDWVCSAEQSRRIAAAIPGARFELLPQGGHWMMHQEPETLARLVDDFLTNIAAAPVIR